MMVCKSTIVFKMIYLFIEGANNYYTATFKAGETLTKVDIDIKEDSVVETVKQYSFMLNGSNQSVPLQLGTPDHLQVDVIDNDGNE